MAAFRQALLVGEGVDIPVPEAALGAIEAAYAFTTEFQANFARFEAHARSIMPDVVLDIDIDKIDQAARIAKDEGIPVAWVPRLAITRVLINLPDEEARLAHLEAVGSEVIDDCRALARGSGRRWMAECLEAATALSDGHCGPAQSHAANVIDTLVVDVGRAAGLSLKKARKEMVTKAGKPLDDEMQMTAVGEALAMMPLLSALQEYWPDKGDPIPRRFSRHATAHAVGQKGVSSPTNALISIMLATSLARQFG
jgi:hypothetical protein